MPKQDGKGPVWGGGPGAGWGMGPCGCGCGPGFFGRGFGHGLRNFFGWGGPQTKKDTLEAINSHKEWLKEKMKALEEMEKELQAEK
jgi:hypothetical protein